MKINISQYDTITYIAINEGQRRTHIKVDRITKEVKMLRNDFNNRSNEFSTIKGGLKND